jgi:hypothetical protein
MAKREAQKNTSWTDCGSSERKEEEVCTLYQFLIGLWLKMRRLDAGQVCTVI